ncbi:hypothetical protein ANME2D_03451 [Candidatus Methanoperedens nitroreducens]|uniref:Uncharacterized protein n=1 Tax=Candidatus Methanoperedens nitratireducens TaxID=1392998 RepID=A0A062V4K4_9EURY|nr:hypothetical protein [Candidatus Methanoperedens nitroreducens]KCZ70335.1 hypothetical protein ANME2D_03451 [Candidatus Methanoperedens nitroreducens]MDJ1421373.1 hypothetical protein [Candidatus Methanoperedens sp.]
MPKIEVDLTDKEFEILNSLEKIEGKDGEKLRNLYRYYLSSIPELKSKDYELKRFEDKDEIDEILKSIFGVYKKTEYPVDAWENDKIDKLIDELTEINVLEMTEGVRIVPTKFRDLFKLLLYDIATENKDMDEHVAALIAVIQLLKEFGVGTLNKETIRDAAILINEGWLYIYAKKMREAREFLKTKKLKLIDDESMKAFHQAVKNA